MTLEQGAVSGGEAGIYEASGFVTVNGGTVQGATGILMGQGVLDDAPGLYVSGGEITGTAGPALKLEATSEDAYALLSGGTFSGSPNAIESDTLPVAEMLSANSGYYGSGSEPLTLEEGQLVLPGAVTVKRLPGTPVAEVLFTDRTRQQYTSIDEAWAAAVENSVANNGARATVYVLDDAAKTTRPLKVTGGATIRLYAYEGTLTADIWVGDSAGGYLDDYTKDQLIFADGDLKGHIDVYGGSVTVEEGARVDNESSEGIGINCHYGYVTVESGAEVTGNTAGIAVHANNSYDPLGHLKVSGGTISGGKYGIAIPGGEVTIADGSTSGTEAGVYVGYGTLSLVYGHVSGPVGVLVAESAGEYDTHIAIAGGEITGTNGPALQVDAANAKSVVDLSDGIFTGSEHAIMSKTSPLNDLLADGFAYFDEDGNKLTVAAGQTETEEATVQVMSAGPVARVNNKDYYSIDEAWEAAAEDGWATVELLKDTTARYSLWVEDDAHITLDGGGHTLTADINISWDEDIYDMGYTADDLTIQSCNVNGMITLQGGSLRVESGCVLQDPYTPINCYYGDVILSDATLIGGQDGICIHGGWHNPLDDSYLQGYLTVHGGSIEGKRYGLFQTCGGEVSINSGEFTGGEAGLYVDLGTLTVHDATVSGGKYGVYVDELRDDEPVELTICDGTFTGGSDAALRLHEDSGAYAHSLAGGTFITKSGGDVIRSNKTPVGDLPAEGLGYVDEHNATVTPEPNALTLAGPTVTIQSPDPVARVTTASGDEQEYYSFERAWEAAAEAGKDGAATLTLLMDVTARHDLDLDTGGSVIFEGGDHTLTLDDVIDLGVEDEENFAYTNDALTVKSGTINGTIMLFGGSLTVDGGTVTSKGHTVMDYYGKVTVNGGTVSTTRDDGHGVAIGAHEYGEGGQVTINGGTVSAGGYGISSIGGHVEVNGGTVSGVERGIYAAGDTVIHGGVITSENGAGVVVDGYSFDTIDLTVTGGTITGGGGPGLVMQEYCSAHISGGTFDGDPIAVECAEDDEGFPLYQTLDVNDLLEKGYGYFDKDDMPVIPTEDQMSLEGPVTVHGTAIVAEVTANGKTTRYASIEGAWRAANAAGGPATLTLLADVTAKDTLDITAGGNVTFRGGDHTLTLGDDMVLGWERDLAYNDGHLTVESGTIQGTIFISGGNLTVKGGTITSPEDVPVWFQWGEMTVDGGTISSDSGRDAILVQMPWQDDDDNPLNAKLTVNGGTISGGDYGIFARNKVIVNGGTISGKQAGIYAEYWGDVTIHDGDISGQRDGVFVERCNQLTITGGKFTGTERAGLCVAGDRTPVSLSGGTFAGGQYGIECRPSFLYGEALPVDELLAAGYGYFDAAGKRVTPDADQTELTGPITVRKLAASSAGGQTSDGVPHTGDSASLLPWALLLAVCTTALAALVPGLRRRREK